MQPAALHRGPRRRPLAARHRLRRAAGHPEADPGGAVGVGAGGALHVQSPWPNYIRS
jgi:hypothetical protein